MREKLLEVLEKEFDALDIMTIYHKMDLNSAEELRELQYELGVLMNELEVYETKKKKYILYSKCPNFKKGKIQVKKDFGFLLQDGEDVYIGKEGINYALDGDTVLVEVFASEDPKREFEGRVIKVLERDLKNIVGEIKNDHGTLYFEPREKKNIQLTVDPESMEDCLEGEIVVVQIVDCDKKNRCLGKVVQKICHKDDPNQEILSIAAQYEIYEDFPEEVLKQIESIPSEVRPSDLTGRVDVRDKMIVTIDGSDTKDIDDAISYEYDPVSKRHTLGVYIADVSYYVTEGSPLEEELIRRGTSAYLADTVIPMLPRKLSNGICSLNENVDRLALGCVMEVEDDTMRVVDTNIFPAVIRSSKKMCYEQVNKVLDGEEDYDPSYEPFKEMLIGLNKFAKKIRKQREKRGASDFDVPEPKPICDEKHECIGFKKVPRGDGERLIEDCMVLTNEQIATRLSVLDLAAIFRVHDVPKPEKVQEFISFCEIMGIHIKGKFKNVEKPSVFKKLLEQVIDQCQDHPDKEAIMKQMAVRSMCRAVYSDCNYGHFGLASACYTHYTSPIRRLCDFIVHRMIRKFLFEGKTDDRTINYYKQKMTELAKQATDREQAATQAERDVDKLMMAELMEKHIGEEAEGVIVSVEKYGFYVQLDNLVEGLVPVASLTGDYYEYVEELKCFIGKSTKIRYSLGDRVPVKCVAASREAKTVDFNLVKTLTRDKDEMVLTKDVRSK